MQQTPRKSALSYYFKMFLGMGYIAIAIIFLTTEAGTLLIGSKGFGWAFGMACLVYGLFRMYRAVKNWDTPDREL
jgi:hypothetical protein